jgi:hypothetical protein
MGPIFCSKWTGRRPCRSRWHRCRIIHAVSTGRGCIKPSTRTGVPCLRAAEGKVHDRAECALRTSSVRFLPVVHAPTVPLRASTVKACTSERSPTVSSVPRGACEKEEQTVYNPGPRNPSFHRRHCLCDPCTPSRSETHAKRTHRSLRHTEV